MDIRKTYLIPATKIIIGTRSSKIVNFSYTNPTYTLVLQHIIFVEKLKKKEPKIMLH
jgi:hypothetical protein